MRAREENLSAGKIKPLLHVAETGLVAATGAAAPAAAGDNDDGTAAWPRCVVCRGSTIRQDRRNVHGRPRRASTVCHQDLGVFSPYLATTEIDVVLVLLM